MDWGDEAGTETTNSLIEKEVYGDNGFVICLTEADKENFVAYIAAGKGLPPPVEK